MSIMHVHLFGKLDVRRGESVVADLHACKAQQLFAYLLLYRERYHAREVVANLLWPTSAPGRTRKYLRQALWQLQTALDPGGKTGRNPILLVDSNWICLNPEADLWLDVAEFERAYALVQETSGQELDGQQAQIVQQALELYRGDLLEGWYQDWCLFERERLQQLYLVLLEKCMIYCEAHGEYESGLECGIRALRCDVAHERTHRRIMRLRYLAGDRTGALRQYQRCVAFLREELDVEPSARTVALYEQIRSNNPDPLTAAGATPDDPGIPGKMPLPPPETLRQLEQLQTAFLELQCQLQETIETFQVALTQQD